MINFDDLTEVEGEESTFQKFKLDSRKNYIVGADPFDQEEGSQMSVFSVYDRLSCKEVVKMKTNKTFDWFCSFLMLRDYVKSYVISNKFITPDGRAKKPSQIRIETGGFKEYITA